MEAFMKKSTYIFIVLMVLTTVIFVSCEENFGTTNLHLTFSSDKGQSSSREVVSPIGQSLAITGYIVSGNGPNDKSFSITTNSSQADINGLVIGTWEINVIGINQQGTAIASGNKTHHLTTKANNIEIVLDELTGSGSVDIGFYWVDTNYPDLNFSLILKPQNGIEREVNEGLLINHQTASARFQTTLETGSYDLIFSLTSGDENIAGGVVVLRILDGFTSSKEITLVVDKETRDASTFLIKNSVVEPVIGKFVKVIKGGFEVDLGNEFLGFCPLSKADVVRVEDPYTMLGITDYFIIDKFHTGMKLKSVVSRREYLERKIKENKEKFFSTVKIGDVVEGTVKSFTSFGAFIDLGGFDGLLHINDMSWGHVTKPKDFVKKGQQIQLRLINIDPVSQKINLSLKHMQEDPWTTFEERFSVDDVVKAPVTKITSFGVFIEIEPGIEGLAHISELSWTKRINNPKEILSIGDVVEAKILGYDLDKKRVSLGLKQLEENPWDTIAERYPVGMTLTKPVVKLTNSGAFISLEEGIDGFLHIDDISWTKKIRNMSEFCKEGEVIDVVVTRVDPQTRHIRLGVKQLEGNPWQTLKQDYPKGSVISGVISNVTDFGVFVRVLGDIEGLISKFNLVGPDEQFKDSVLEKFKVGEPISAAVMEINPSSQKLSLSIKEMIRKSQQSEISKYIHDDEGDTFTFGDLVKSRENGQQKG
jgi:small subunit ribosomal protein S1